jgi:hypothetical protein
VPGEGFEPPTFGLQNRCTTTVLTRQKFLVAMTCISWIARPPARDASGKESQEEFGQRCARGERGDHLRRNFVRPWGMGSDSKLSQGNARTPAPAPLPIAAKLKSVTAMRPTPAGTRLHGYGRYFGRRSSPVGAVSRLVHQAIDNTGVPYGIRTRVTNVKVAQSTLLASTGRSRIVPQRPRNTLIKQR